MTDDNKKRNIATEIARGEASLRAATVLLAESLFADAVSRAYYAAFHHARALLLTLGEEPRTRGVELLLQRELVRAGRFSPDIGKLLGRLRAYRVDADYTADYVFTRASAEEELAAASRFIEEARRLLVEGDWIPKSP